MKANTIIEKPPRDKAPSNFAHVAAYLFTPEVLSYLEKGRKALEPGKEFWVTDSVIQPMLADGKSIYACEIQNSIRYDTGTPLTYLKTVIDCALEREDIGAELMDYLRKKLL
jgi:UTP--glucose-1-phosphate uridylyltransferase